MDSIAGLMAARVCAGHFEEVVIIDPDNDELVPRARASLGDGRSDPDLAHYPRPRVHQTRVLHATQSEWDITAMTSLEATHDLIWQLSIFGRWSVFSPTSVRWSKPLAECT